MKNVKLYSILIGNKWKKFAITLLLLLYSTFSYSQYRSVCNLKHPDSVPTLKIKMVKKLEGDFSFIDKWKYPEGVELKSNGKPGCADGGYCPQRCYGMLDSNGIVLKDSAELFNQLLDTSHIPFSIECEAKCYEFAGANTVSSFTTDYMGEIETFIISEKNVATHSYIVFVIEKKRCKPWVKIERILNSCTYNSYMKSGTIFMDRKAYRKGIFKLEFDITFNNTINPDIPIHWKGRIYTKPRFIHQKQKKDK